MDKPLRRRLQPEARKLELVEAAERLLQAHGPRVRVEDVVREAGVAKGTFFFYFPKWDDLLETVRDRLAAKFDAAYPLPTEADAPADWPSLVDWQAAAFIDFILSHRGIGDAVFHSDFARRRPQVHGAILHLTAIIRAGQEAKAIGPVDPDRTARLDICEYPRGRQLRGRWRRPRDLPGGFADTSSTRPRAAGPGE